LDWSAKYLLTDQHSFVLIQKKIEIGHFHLRCDSRFKIFYPEANKLLGKHDCH